MKKNLDSFITYICKEKPQEVKTWLTEHGFNENEILKSLDDDHLKQMQEDLK